MICAVRWSGVKRTKQRKKTLKKKKQTAWVQLSMIQVFFSLIFSIKSGVETAWLVDFVSACCTVLILSRAPQNVFKACFRWFIIASNNSKVNENLRPFYAKEAIKFPWTRAAKIVLEITNKSWCFSKPKKR